MIAKAYTIKGRIIDVHNEFPNEIRQVIYFFAGHQYCVLLGVFVFVFCNCMHLFILV